MAEFYPSEIARLVLGYLKEVHCLETWQVFLEECTDLQEHKRLYKEGKFCTTNVNGKSLLDILTEYCSLKDASKESDQNKCSTNTYQVYGVYKTPSKNESAYASYSINQRIQTRSVVKSIQSPRYNLFRSPTSRPSCQTPRRKLDCQNTILNFGPDAQISPRNEISKDRVNKSKRLLFISTSNAQTCNSSPQLSKNNICFSSPGVPTCSNNLDREEGRHSDPIKSKNDASDITEKENFLSSNQVPIDISSPMTNASESEIVQNNDTPDDRHNEISELKIGKQKSSNTITCDTTIAQSSVKSIVCRSEITTGTENIALSLSEVCSTPQYEVEPPPYNRAPDTNSPRIVLSHDRSLIPSLTTPNKDKKSWSDEEWSPKRKGTIPRRRLITESPASKYNQQPEITFDSVIENLFGPAETLFNDPLVQLLTENINKVKPCEAKETDFEGLDDIVKKAVESTEEDPAFERFLIQMCGNNKDGLDHFNVESTPSKLADIDCEKLTDEKKVHLKEITYEHLNDEPNQKNKETSHSFTSYSKPECTNETENSSNVVSNESLNMSKLNNVNSSAPDLVITDRISCPKKVLNSYSNSNSCENKTVASDTVNKLNNLTPNSSANDNSNKDEEISCVIVDDNDASTVKAFEKNVLNDANFSNQDEMKGKEISEGKQSINDDNYEALQINNSSKIAPVNGNQSTSALQITENNQDTCAHNISHTNDNFNTVSSSDIQSPLIVQANNNNNDANIDVQNTLQISNSSNVTVRLGNQSASAIQITESNQTVDACNLQINNNLNAAPSASNQSASAVQINGPNPQLLTQLPQIIPNVSTVLEVPLPSLPAVFVPTLGPDGTVQGSLYRVVINPPVFSSSPIPLPLQVVSSQTIGNPLIATSTPTVPVLNVKNIKSSSTLPVNAENSVTTPKNSKSLILDIGSSDKEITPKETAPCKSSTPPKKRQRISKQKKSDTNEFDKSVTLPSSSVPEKSKKICKKKKGSKRKPLSLFPDSPLTKVNEISCQTPVKDSENEYPVLSVPSPTNQSSAFKYLSQITGKFEHADRSPILKSLISQAAVLSDKKSRCNSSYVRCLDFNADSDIQNKTSDCISNSESIKTPKSASDKINAAARRSSRIQRKKAEILNDSKVVKSTKISQLKKKLKIDSIDVSSSINQIKNVESNDFSSPMFSKALDVFNCVDDDPVFYDDTDHSDSKVNSNIVSNMSSDDHHLTDQTDVAQKSVENQQKKMNVAESTKSLNIINLKENASVITISPEKCNSFFTSEINSLHLQQKRKREAENLDETVGNVESNVNMKNNTVVNTNKKSPVQCKSKVISTVKSDCPFVSLAAYNSSKIPEKSPNGKAGENISVIIDRENSEIIDKSNLTPESPKSKCTKLSYLFLFGSDNEFTPEKDSESLKALSTIISVPSFTSSSASVCISKQLNQPIAETANETSKNKNVSPKMSDFSKCADDKFSSSNTIHSQPEEKFLNTINYKSPSLLSLNKSLTANVSMDIQHKEIEHNLSESMGNFESMTSLKTSPSVKHINFEDIDKKSHSVKERANMLSNKIPALNKDKSVVKNKTPQKKSLESIVSFCKEKESIINNENMMNHVIHNKNQQLEKIKNLKEKEFPESSITSNTNKPILQNKQNSPQTVKVNSTNVGKVLPPPKKRIRPIPVDSSSNESFSSAFTPFLNNSNINKSTCTVSAESNVKKDAMIQDNLNTYEAAFNNKIKEKSDETNDLSVLNSLPIYKTVDLINQSSVLETSVTNFISPSKESASVLEAENTSPKLKLKSVSSSPKLVSPRPTFKQPFTWRSGKPRAMAEIYKNAFPNKVSELPVSPASFSNSSSTFDAFPAKRKLLEDSPLKSSKENSIESSKEVSNNANLCIQEEYNSNTDLRCNSKDKNQKKIIKKNNTCKKPRKNNIFDPKSVYNPNSVYTYKETSILIPGPQFKTYSKTHCIENSSKLSIDNTFDHDDDDNGDLLNRNRERKKSGDSNCSDTCSTVVDFDIEIMTPVKSDDWLKKDLFKKPTPKKSDEMRKASSSSYDSDVSPVKVDNIENQKNLSPHKLKEIGIRDIPVNSTLISKFPQKIIRNSPVSSHTKLDIGIVGSSSDTCISNLGTDIHKSDSASINKNTSKISVGANAIQEQNKSKSVCSQSEKPKNSSNKKERRSRPTLKIGSLNSPCKNKSNDKRKELSTLDSAFRKSVKKRASPIISKNVKPYDKSVMKHVKMSSENITKYSRDQSSYKEKEIIKNNPNNSYQTTNTISKKDVKSCTFTNQNSVISPEKCTETLNHCETTQDIVESDIGRSSDAGSELSIAIASCERELLISQADDGSQSHNCQSSFELNIPRKSLPSNHEIKCSNSPKTLDEVMNKIKTLSPKKINSLFEKIKDRL